MIKLNLGAGQTEITGYTAIDRKLGSEAYPLSYDDNTVDEIRASHILEHFSHQETLDVVRDWARALKPGGVLKIAVPDWEKLSALMESGHHDLAEAFLFGAHTDADDHHGAAFTADKLAAIFEAVGFERVEPWRSEIDDCAALPFSLNLQGVKPLVEKGTLEFHGVTAVLPTPRYGPSEHHRCIYEALANLKMRMRCVGGCFWNQHLCESIEAEIADPECRYILTLDYDSIFTVQDVIDMYRIVETHPQIDALVPLQSHRNSDIPLFTIGDCREIGRGLFDHIATPISTGHFGLTFIRAEKLRNFERPWMLGQPNADGRWGQGHVDPDIYFWRKWVKAGNTAYLAPRVSIGHIQDMILWPAKTDLKPIPQRMADYLNHGKPPEAK